MRGRVLVAPVIAAVLTGGCGSDSGGNDQPSAKPTPAEKLADLDGGDVATFDRYLASLGRKCREKEPRIAALVYGTQQTMAEDGIKESLAKLIKHLDQSVPPNRGKLDCAGAFAAYATLRAKG